ncbi:MAG: glycoside hydrolase family 57 protein [Planctomycetota bacterium]
MTSVVFYFQAHQPDRLRARGPYAPGGYFDEAESARIVRRVAERCYLPMNELLLRAVEETDGRFHCAFSISGPLLRQLEAWAPEVLESFASLAATERVEFLCETAYHSLASLVPSDEFEDQVRRQARRIEELFGQRPTVFRNTELIFDESIARRVEALGFDVLLAEGADRLLGWRSPRFVYRPRGCRRLKLLLRDYMLSDDIAFRFGNREWVHHPLLAETFAGWLHAIPARDTFAGLFMDYETFGEHQGAETGIFAFMRALPRFVLDGESTDFATPSEIAAAHDAVGEIDAPSPVSWADARRDLGAWLGNHMQRSAHESLYALAPGIRTAAAHGHPALLEAWRRLTTSDHFRYMATRSSADEGMHEHFSPHDSPYDSFIVFMNVLDDLRSRVAEVLSDRIQRESSEDPRV